MGHADKPMDRVWDRGTMALVVAYIETVRNASALGRRNKRIMSFWMLDCGRKTV